MRVTQVNESAHLNSVRNLILPTDRPTARIPWAGTLCRPLRAGVQVGWMEKWTEVQRR